MSHTLHTTEIWLDTDTDSGGMKDRTHGIFLQKMSVIEDANQAQDRQTDLLVSNSHSFFFLILIHSRFPKVMQHNKGVSLQEHRVLKLFFQC